jgi:hypothetical protein
VTAPGALFSDDPREWLPVPGRCNLGELRSKWPGVIGRTGLLQLDEDDVSRRLADVLAVMRLGWQPPDSARVQGHLSPDLTGHEAPTEGRQRVHDAVGVLVRGRVIAWVVGVLKHPNSVVLEDHLVMIGVAGHRVDGAHGVRISDVRSPRKGCALIPRGIAVGHSTFGLSHGAQYANWSCHIAVGNGHQPRERNLGPGRALAGAALTPQLDEGAWFHSSPPAGTARDAGADVVVRRRVVASMVPVR